MTNHCNFIRNWYLHRLRNVFLLAIHSLNMQPLLSRRFLLLYLCAGGGGGNSRLAPWSLSNIAINSLVDYRNIFPGQLYRQGTPSTSHLPRQFCKPKVPGALTTVNCQRPFQNEKAIFSARSRIELFLPIATF